jgi:hypothetical protein
MPENSLRNASFGLLVESYTNRETGSGGEQQWGSRFVDMFDFGALNYSSIDNFKLTLNFSSHESLGRAGNGTVRVQTKSKEQATKQWEKID